MPKNKSLFDEIANPVIGLFIILLLYLVWVKSWVYLGFVVIISFGLLLYVFSRMRNNGRSQFFQSKVTLDSLRKLTPNQFEDYIADLFHRLGYRTEKVGGGYDGGIDVIAEKDGVKHFIQCKRFITRQVTVHDIRDFYGALTDRLSNVKGFFITTNIFTLEAEKFAEGKALELVDGAKLMDYVKLAGINIPAVNEETCPRCGGVLKERQGKYGSFIGCSNYSKCKFTKHK